MVTAQHIACNCEQPRPARVSGSEPGPKRVGRVLQQVLGLQRRTEPSGHDIFPLPVHLL